MSDTSINRAMQFASSPIWRPYKTPEIHRVGGYSEVIKEGWCEAAAAVIMRVVLTAECDEVVIRCWVRAERIKV